MLRVQSTVDNAAQRVTGMDVIAQTGAPANRETEHASSTQHDHVSRGTRRRLCPTTSSACLSHVRWGRTLLPFTSSSCAAERARGGPEARRRSRSAQRCDDEGRAAVTRRHRRAGVRRAGRESALIVGTGQCQRRGRRMDYSDTHHHPPPSSNCFPWFHVKLASGRSLARFLRIRASAS